MEIFERKVGGVVVIDLHGRIVTGDGDRTLREVVTRQPGNARILLNFADVPFVDSAVVGEIVRTYTTVTRSGGEVKLINLTPRIRNLLSSTRLLTVLEAYESEDEALRSF
jgi:anti-sigma B factor antagonist